MMAASDSDFAEPEADDEIDEVLEGHILNVPPVSLSRSLRRFK